MEKEILDLLRVMQSDIIEMKSDITSMKSEIGSMKSDITSMKSEMSSMNKRFDKIEKKLDSVHTQTAELTEFREETRIGIENIKNVTKINCYDIATLKIHTKSFDI